MGYQKGKSAPGVTTYGDWSPFTWDNKGTTQHGLHLTPTQAPWREVLQALDAVPELPAQPIDVWQEAAAMVAACWRYGSYAMVLAEGQPYPPFQTDPNLSRISDPEMMRIQLEFSSGLAEWLRVRSEQPEVHQRRVRAARHLMPNVPLANVGPYILAEYAEKCLHRYESRLVLLGEVGLIPESALTPQEAFRAEANFLVDTHYRRGSNITASGEGISLEEIHAGAWSEGIELPGYKRLYAADIAALMKPILRGLTIHLAAADSFDMREFQPVFRTPGLNSWSLTQETSAVSFHGLPDFGPLEPRLKQLAQKNAVIYAN